MKKIKVGLVGFGLSGRFLQAPFFEALPQFELSKVVTSRSIPRELFPTASNALSTEQLLEDKELDLIAICSPNSTHFELTKKCLEAGKNVLVEKPIAATSEETKELYAIAKKNNLVLCVYQNRRFDSDFLTCIQVIKSRFLGEIHTYEAHFHRFKPELNPKKWKEESAASNGVLYDLGAHLIDQAIFLFGKPDSYSGEVYSQRNNTNIDDAFFVQMKYGSLRVRLKSSLLVTNPGPRYEIHGTFGSFFKSGIDLQEDHLKMGYFPFQENFGIESEANHGDLTTTINGLQLKSKVITKPGSWHLLYQNLADAILNGAELVIKEDEIIAQMEILESIKNRL